MKLHGTKNLTRDHINKLITKKLNFLYFSKPIENMANSNMRCDSFKSLMIINKLSKFL